MFDATPAGPWLVEPVIFVCVHLIVVCLRGGVLIAFLRSTALLPLIERFDGAGIAPAMNHALDLLHRGRKRTCQRNDCEGLPQTCPRGDGLSALHERRVAM